MITYLPEVINIHTTLFFALIGSEAWRLFEVKGPTDAKYNILIVCNYLVFFFGVNI